MRLVSVCGLAYAALTPEKAALLAREKIRTGGFFSVFTVGATMHARALRSEEERRLLSAADLILPDGQGVVLASRFVRDSLSCRCAGIVFAEALLERADWGTRFFFYGGREGVAARAAKRMAEKYPHLSFACASGYGEDPIDEITAFSPHALFVCLGFPRQEKYILVHRDRLTCLCVGLGGSFDVWSGDVPRAPLFLQKCGLEWAYRTLREPRRIPRLFPLPAYFFAAAREGLKKKRKQDGGKDGIG